VAVGSSSSSSSGTTGGTGTGGTGTGMRYLTGAMWVEELRIWAGRWPCVTGQRT
jgi:hypothetical protein